MLMTKKALKKIDIKYINSHFSDSNILNYGKELQSEIASFTDSVLSQTSSKELLDTTDSLIKLQKAMKETERKNLSGKLNLFQKIKYMFIDKIEDFKNSASNALQIVGTIEDRLKEQQNILIEDAKSYDQMQVISAKYLKSLDKLISDANEDIKLSKKYLKDNSKNIDKEELKKLYDNINSFEHRIADLSVTRSLVESQIPTMEIAKRSNVIQNNKIDVIINNTIPIWKQGMVMALYQAHSDFSAKNVKMVTDMTNQLLKSNAENNKEISKKIAIETERPIIDIETIEYNNQKLLETINDISKIVKQGKVNRANMLERLNKNSINTAKALEKMMTEDINVVEKLQISDKKGE